MRLLSPPQGKSLLASDVASQQVRSVEIDNIIRAKRKEISELDNVLVNSLSELGKKGSTEEQFWKERISNLTHEVEGLESRRKSALVPLEAKEKELEDKERVLLKREELVDLQESENISSGELLEKRLDDVSEREQTALNYAKSLEIRSQNISLQENNIRIRQEALVSIIQQVNKDKKLAEEEINQQKAILKGREVILAEREALCTKKEAGFANREKKILDQYRTLQSTITEVNLTNDHTGFQRSKRTE